MDATQIRERFLNFFAKRGHRVILSASLVPENDPSVLFTTAGMQQFKPYYTGQKDAPKDFNSKNIVSIQKCVRTSDIEEVGDNTHLTFFEMLGNFSFGGYWKKEAIEYAYDFITKELGLTIDCVSVFEGDTETPADNESRKIWQKIDPKLKIKNHNRADNFWGPTGEEGPCGPTTEIYLNGVEIWNIVFNEFYKTKEGKYEPLKVRGIDTGMGLERLAKVVQKVPTVFETDLFAPVIAKIQGLSLKKPQGESLRAQRIVADHIRTVVFLIADGIIPSNTDRGYVLRRLLRRAVRYADVLKIKTGSLSQIGAMINNSVKIKTEIEQEETRFRQTLQIGLKEFEGGTDPFILFTSYGFPLELIKELAMEKGVKVDEKKFAEEMKKHQEISRAGAEQKFKGGLADHSEKVIQYHTATHLLHQALRDVLGDHVEQKGSNITDERLRFDFSHSQKMTEEEKRKVEEIVNQKIRANLPVQNIVLPRAEAEKVGALHFFDGDLPAGKAGKYGDQVSIYFIGDSLETAYSKEFCGGPHIKNTSDLKGTFKIIKEEAIAAGIRRIRAVLLN